MAAEVYEDALELTVPILEAVLPDSEQYLSTAYPYPSLRVTGRSERRRFRTIVLENPYLRVVIVPDLGGRILRIFDKRTGIDIFPDEPLTPIEGGLRGVEVAQGIQIRYTPQDRPNSLGTVNYQLVQAVDEDDDAGVWIGEVSGPLSFNSFISIPPNETEIKIEMRMFNRMIDDTPYNGGISIALAGSQSNYAKNRDDVFRAGYLIHSDNKAISLWSEQYSIPGVWHERDRLHVHRFGRHANFALSARQLDTWNFKICPHTGLSWPMVTCAAAALAVVDQGISIQASRPLSARLKLIDASDVSFEANVDAIPEKRLDLPFENALSLKAIYLSEVTGGNLLRQRHGIKTKEVVDNNGSSRDAMAEQDTMARANIRTFHEPGSHFSSLLPSIRYEISLKQAHSSAFTKGRREEIDHLLEQALLYNGEDHLAWWMKAVHKRVQEGAQDSAELLNAHYLAPLEPCLRAEGFLSQPIAQGREANPILRPLDDSPEQFVEVACQLMTWWLFAEASRFLDEALRHVDLPMLRYLQAYALTEAHMDVEAASHVRAAGAKPVGPPFPWRLWEQYVLRTLHRRFPDDKRLQQYLELADKFANLTLTRSEYHGDSEGVSRD